MIGTGLRAVERVTATALLAAVALVAAASAGAAEPRKIDLARGQQIAAQVCAACHGADGNSTGVTNPKLSAQHADYTYKQLVNFRPAAQDKQPERPNPIMTPFATQLSEQDKRDVAAFYAAQPLKPSVARNKDLVALGQQIYRGGIPQKSVPSCAGCHGPSGSGIPAQYPRLGGQFAEYTEAQLVAFRSGQRHNSAQMTTIAERMSDREIKAVADYVAGLR
jgi:cytochrome c553